MVGKEASLYLLIGGDVSSKDLKLKSIKRSLLSQALENFNLDTLYAKDLALAELQEKLLCLPVRTKKRILVIRDAQALKEPLRDFLLEYSRKPAAHLVLILDLEHYDPKDDFILRMSRLGQAYRFKETLPINTFNLTRQIELKRPDYALKTLHQLLKNGEKAERIVGGLRHSLLKTGGNPAQSRRILRFLLDCDVAIKTGKLKPGFALERCVVQLCCLGEFKR
ncbi:MAG: hypothetical protein V2A59_04180 [Candidatus Omnitrophota bacterium]